MSSGLVEPDIADLLAAPASMRRAWLGQRNLGLLRLNVDVIGASRIPVKRTGEHVLAYWQQNDPMIATGWMIQGCGFLCVLSEPDIEVVK